MAQGIDYEKLAQEAREKAAANRVAQSRAANPPQSSGLTVKQLLALEKSGTTPSGFSGVDQATERQWAGAGLPGADLLPPGPEKKAAMAEFNRRNNQYGKNLALTYGAFAGGEAIGALSALTGGEAIAAATGATKIARPWAGALTRIGGNAGIGGGLSAIEGGDWKTGALVGGGVGAAAEGLVGVAPAIMEGAMRISAPIARKFGKFGELGSTAIRNRLLGGTLQAAEGKPSQARWYGPPTTAKPGANELIGLRRADKTALTDSVEQPILTKPIADDVAAQLKPNMQADWESGMRAPDVKESPIITRFRQRSPREELWSTAQPDGPITGPGTPGKPVAPWNVQGSKVLGGVDDYGELGGSAANVKGPYQPIKYVSVKGPGQRSATRTDQLKSRYDNQADALHRAGELGNKKAGDRAVVARAMAERSGKAVKDSLQGRGDEYTDLNREIMNLKGIELASKGRVAIPGRGLDNLGVMWEPTMTRLALRLARVPGLASRGALLANDIGTILRDPAARAAILSSLLGSDGPKKEVKR